MSFTWLSSLFSLLFPPCCVVCGDVLVRGEEYLCSRCNIGMPRTGYAAWPGNPVERMFWGKIPVERASSYFFYYKGSDFRLLLHRLKYGGCKELGESMGRAVASEIRGDGFFRGIDCIVPVPLHREKERRRGYNQSEWIARGIAAVTHLPLYTTAVCRIKNTETQTRKSSFERWENVEGTFLLRHPELFVGRHILLVDDVLTTGATTVACASAFDEVKGIRISVLTLAVAGN